MTRGMSRFALEGARRETGEDYTNSNGHCGEWPSEILWSCFESQETPARDRRPGNEVSARARHSQTRASLDIEKGVLPCHQLHRRLHLLGMGHGTGARRPRGPRGVRPHEVLRQDAPEPWMRSGLVVYDDIVYTFRGVKNQWHDDTPSRRLLRR